jgi:hypothetical protein
MQMKTIFSLLISALLGYFLMPAGFATNVYAHEGKDAKGSFTKHFKETFFDITAKAEFSVEILPDDKEYKKLGKDVVGIVIHNSHDEDVEKAAISIDFRNLDTGEPATEKPMVKERGDGLYIVSNLDLRKEGRWKLTITVKKSAVEDSVQFLFPDVLKSRLPAGRYNP